MDGYCNVRAATRKGREEGAAKKRGGVTENTESEPQMSDYETKTEQQRLNTSSREGHQHRPQILMVSLQQPKDRDSQTN